MTKTKNMHYTTITILSQCHKKQVWQNLLKLLSKLVLHGLSQFDEKVMYMWWVQISFHFLASYIWKLPPLILDGKILMEEIDSFVNAAFAINVWSIPKKPPQRVYMQPFFIRDIHEISHYRVDHRPPKFWPIGYLQHTYFDRS